MSFWDRLSSDISRSVQSLQNQVTNAFNYPTEAMCPSCQTVNGVPPATFDWVCLNGHLNNANLEYCSQCAKTKADTQRKGLYQPRINCYRCSRGFAVSTTKVASWGSQQIQTAPQQAQTLVDTVSSQLKTLSSAPVTFHCNHCQTLLHMPTGPWQCSVCQFHNPDGTNCTNPAKHCNHSRYNDTVLCVVCQQSTSIPLYKITDQLKALGHKINATTRQGYFDYWSQEPYMMCSVCKLSNPLTKEEYSLLFPDESNSIDSLGGTTSSYQPPQPPYQQPQPQSQCQPQVQPQTQYQPPAQQAPVDPYAASQPSLYPSPALAVDPYQAQQQQQPTSSVAKDLDGDAPPSYDQTNPTPAAGAAAPQPDHHRHLSQPQQLEVAPPVKKPVESQPIVGSDGITYPTIAVTCSGCKVVNVVSKKNIFGADKKAKKSSSTTTTTATATTAPQPQQPPPQQPPYQSQQPYQPQQPQTASFPPQNAPVAPQNPYEREESQHLLGPYTPSPYM